MIEGAIRALLPELPALGFGTGTLLNNRRTRRRALYLLETARGCGITYFDTARMYGAGRVEQVLGQMLARDRSRIILVTKAGILPQSRLFHIRLMGLAARLMRSAVPAVKRYIGVPKAAQLTFGVFERDAFRASVEASLRALRTDYIDILLLHECFPGDLENPGLLEFLHQLKEEGKIRAFGLGTGIEQTCTILGARPELSEAVQIPSSIFDRNIERLPAGVALPVIHSLLTPQFHKLRAELMRDPAQAKAWEAATGVDPRDASAMVQLFLAYALHSNPSGVTLFYSSKPAHIVANAKSFQERRFGASQLGSLERLINRERSNGIAFLPRTSARAQAVT